MASDGPRYAVSDLPAGRVRVRVQWNGRLFEAARIEDDKKRWRWCVLVVAGDSRSGSRPPAMTGEVRWLPPAGRDGRGWSPEPDWWQPLDPAAFWKGRPVPTPLPDQIHPVMISATARGRRWAAMAEQAAEAERIRAEIEADEAVAPAPEDVPEPAAPTYSPAGSISRGEALARVCRAILTDGAQTDGSPFGIAIAGDDAVTAERFEPTRADLADYLVAYGWFTALQPPEERPRRQPAYAFNARQRILARHAHGASLRAIAKAENLGHPETARARLALVVDAVHRLANGGPLHLHRRSLDQIAALRTRNRQHRSRIA